MIKIYQGSMDQMDSNKEYVKIVLREGACLLSGRQSTKFITSSNGDESFQSQLNSSLQKLDVSEVKDYSYQAHIEDGKVKQMRQER